MPATPSMTINYYGGDAGFFFTDAFLDGSDSVASTNVTGASSTQISFLNSFNGATTVVNGTNFALSGGGIPTGGTATSMSFTQGSTLVADFQDISWSLVSMNTALLALGSGNVGPVKALFNAQPIIFDAMTSTVAAWVDIGGGTMTTKVTALGSNYGDRLLGEMGNDNLKGRGGNDTLAGRDGNDRLNGGGGRDKLDGGNGRDNLNGGGGRDMLIGGKGDDTLTGGTGPDTFLFKGGNIGSDEITDFSKGTDQLKLDDALWSGTLTEQQVIDTYASVVGGDTVFDFGNGNQITLTGVGSLSNLADDILIF